MRGRRDRLRALEAKLERLVELNGHIARHDTLTGLPNREQFGDEVACAIAAADGAGACVAVFMLDVDRFQEVNLALGHQEGDRVLAQVAERLAAVGGSERTARLGGDAFGVVVTTTSGGWEEAEAAACELRRALDPPFLSRGVPILVEATIGIAVQGLHGDDADTLLRHADIAMHSAKDEGEPLMCYAPTLHGADPDRLLLAGELRRALERRELVLDFQPKIDLSTGEVICAEALVRWLHPSRGRLVPGEFIPLAERTGLIQPLTSYVLDEALRQHVRWARQGTPARVAVNVSARSLRDGGLADEVARRLREHGIPPDRLLIETTESAIIRDPARAKAVLDRLGRQGVQIALDDFGTGYSSLALLRRLPLDQIKIDRSFVASAVSEESDAAIVHSLVNLGHDLGLTVVAEGIEDGPTVVLLQAIGCDLGQGYHLSPPLGADLFCALLGNGVSAVA